MAANSAALREALDVEAKEKKAAAKVGRLYRNRVALFKQMPDDLPQKGVWRSVEASHTVSKLADAAEALDRSHEKLKNTGNFASGRQYNITDGEKR